jgi:hypothetical protein
MAAFLFKALLVAQLAQSQVPSPESLAVLTARVARDSGDAAAWLALGRAQLGAAAAYHTHAGPPDTAWARNTIASAEAAFGRAAALRPGLGLGDSAATFRVLARADLAALAWELNDTVAADSVWRALPGGVRLPPVLEEMAENFLRACPQHAVLLTDNEIVTGATEYLRFNHGIRPDLLTIPMSRYRSDSVFVARAAKDAGLKRPPRRAESAEARVLALGALRPVCAGMDFGSPPGGHGRIAWQVRPLVWVAGKNGSTAAKVPAADFVFAALKFAIDANDPWGRFALDIYRHAARLSPALCQPLASYGVPRSRTGCRA